MMRRGFDVHVHYANYGTRRVCFKLPIREMLIAADFRALHIAHMAFNYGDGLVEPPVPAGLADEHYAISRLCEFWEVDSGLIKVAAECSVPASQPNSDDEIVQSWLNQLSKEELSNDLRRCLSEPSVFPV